MSRREARIQSSFASRTAFDALVVESGEDTEEEELPAEEHASAPSIDVSTTQESASPVSVNQPPKPSKAAQKRAARLARQQLKEDKNSANKNPSTGSEPSVERKSPLGSLSNPVEILPEVELPPQPEVNHKQSNTASAYPTPNTNGHAPHDSGPSPKRHTSSSYVKPPAFPTPPLDMAMHQTPQSITVGPIERKPDNDRQGVIEENTKESEVIKKRRSFLVRTLWTLIMIGGFLLCLAMGHAYMVVLVMLIQMIVYREVTALFSLGVSKSDEDEKKGKDPWSKTLNWYFFAVTNYFLYGESLIYYFKHVVFADAQLLPFATNHRFISFTLYIIGFVGFVASLRRQHLKSQFGLFCWVHMSLLVVVISSHFVVNNILEGLIWFWVPASLVICNDIFAYIWGITFGRTPLIRLSPKKTVEGFVGAFFSTILFGLIWGTFFMRFNFMICPAHDLGMNAFNNIECVPNNVFVWREWAIWPPLSIALSTLLQRPVTTIPYAPYQFHLLVMSCFASLVAPFGGFFASGFKRAFDIKDFGHSIPGHGGMTDRMDCQFLMGVFIYVYYSSLIKEHHVTVGYVLQLIVSSLSLNEQLELMDDFTRYLQGRGVSV